MSKVAVNKVQYNNILFGSRIIFIYISQQANIMEGYTITLHEGVDIAHQIHYKLVHVFVM